MTASLLLFALGAKPVESLTIGDAFRDSLTTPLGIGLRLARSAGLVVLARIDRASYLAGE